MFSEVEELEDQLAWAGEHWPQEGRDRIARAIDRLWSIAFDLPLNPTRLSPLQGFDVMHDQEGLLATWPAAPDPAEFQSARAAYLAELACTNRYIAVGMWRRAKPPDGSREELDPVLEQALVAHAASGVCPVLAEVLRENQYGSDW